jgi:hypothetical protein
MLLEQHAVNREFLKKNVTWWHDKHDIVVIQLI